MEEQRPGEGGPANSPPFPRPAGSPPEIRPDEGAALQTQGSEPGGADDAETRGDPPAASGEDIDGAPLPGRPGGRRTDESLGGGARRFASAAGDEVRRRAERGVHRGFERVADRLEEVADRIGALAEDRLQEPVGRLRAAEAAHSTAGWIDDAAQYLRSHDLEDLQQDLERFVREKPLQTILLAASAGWILGKIMR